MAVVTPFILIALSGGVDSAVVAWLLKQKKYHLEAAFMQNWQETAIDQPCLAAQDLKDAQAVCEMLQIKLHTVNFSTQYWQNSISAFFR